MRNHSTKDCSTCPDDRKRGSCVYLHPSDHIVYFHIDKQLGTRQHPCPPPPLSLAVFALRWLPASNNPCAADHRPCCDIPWRLVFRVVTVCIFESAIWWLVVTSTTVTGSKDISLFGSIGLTGFVTFADVVNHSIQCCSETAVLQKFLELGDIRCYPSSLAHEENGHIEWSGTFCHPGYQPAFCSTLSRRYMLTCNLHWNHAVIQVSFPPSQTRRVARCFCINLSAVGGKIPLQVLIVL